MSKERWPALSYFLVFADEMKGLVLTTFGFSQLITVRVKTGVFSVALMYNENIYLFSFNLLAQRSLRSNV